MVTIWLIILVVAIVFGVAIGVWLALRRRTSGRTGPFQSQDRETPAKPIIGEVEKPAVCDEGEKDPIELTAATNLESQGDDHLDLNDDEDNDESKKEKGKEQTATPVEDSSSTEAPKEQPSETVISPEVQDGMPQSPVLSIDESTEDTEVEIIDSEIGRVIPQHEEPITQATDLTIVDRQILQQPSVNDGQQTELSTDAGSDIQNELSGIQSKDELQRDLSPSMVPSSTNALDEAPTSKAKNSEHSPLPSASSSFDSAVASETIDMLTQTEPGKTVEQSVDETVGTQRQVSESIEVEITPPKLDKQKKNQALVVSTKELYATGDTETKSEDTRTAVPILLEDEMPVIKHETEKQPDRSNGNDVKLVSAKRRKTTPRQKPPKYQPSIRTHEATQRTRSTHRTETESSRERSLPMHVHVVLHRRNRCRVSLLPSRAADFDEEIEVSSPNGKETWSACQDEWYSDISPANIGVLLEKGGDWKAGQEGEAKRRWVLSSREIYVLAPCSTISAFVSVPRLILYEDHVVLCTERQEEFVKNALTKAGCSEPAVISGDNGVPKGWVLFHSVCPTCPVEHDEAVDIFNILRPIHDLEIILGGGIRLTHTTWINGHPPHIRVRGAKDNNLQVMIDGKAASADADGIYTAEGWDSPGTHNVFCGGVTQSYELSDGPQHWEGFEAFEYCLGPQQTSEQVVTICGPIVAANNEMSEAVLTPSRNARLFGAIPGQIAFCPRQCDMRTSEYLAIVDFPVTWTLPANPLQCDRSMSCVKLIRAKEVASAQNSTSSRDEILRWSCAILNTSRKRIRIEPDTGEAKELWAEYKQVARRLWKQLR